MLLNDLAGRTINDITQYPVFPWILKDYSSTSININNPNIYRDLSKPMGAQNKIRAKEFQQRYIDSSNFEHENPPFHYGTHIVVQLFVYILYVYNLILIMLLIFKVVNMII